MSEMTQFVRNKSLFLHELGDSQRAISQKPGISRHGVQPVLKTFKESGQVEDKRTSDLSEKTAAFGTVSESP